MGQQSEVRRFRPGLDYTVAHYGILTKDPQLDAGGWGVGGGVEVWGGADLGGGGRWRAWAAQRRGAAAGERRRFCLKESWWACAGA